LIERTLKGAAVLFGTERVAVDTTTSNASRITKVVGTVSAKGDHVPDRPWRLATAKFNPAPVVVSRELLEAIAALAPTPAPRGKSSSKGHDSGRAWDVRDVLKNKGIGSTEKELTYATAFTLDRCLTSSDHVNGASILEFPSGALAYTCRHNRCQGKGWQDVRGLLDLPTTEGGVTVSGEKPNDPKRVHRNGRHDPDEGRTDDDDTRLPPVLMIESVASVEARAIDWLWPNWLARGKLHVFGGHGGDGKSTLTAWLAAALSIGDLAPDGHLLPVGRSLFLLGEDDVGDTLRPRLEVHGADLARIDFVSAVREGDRERVPSLIRNIDLLRAGLLGGAYSLFVIDPLTAFMQGSDRNAEGDVRDALTPLVKAAGEVGLAVLAIMHLNKMGTAPGRRVLQNLLGASAFGNLARLVWMTAEVPDSGDDQTPARRVLGVVKTNIGVRPAPLEWSRPADAAIAWHGQSEHDIQILLSGTKPAPLDTAKSFLFDELKGGSKTPDGLRQAAKADGISWATLRRAKEALGVVAFKTGFGAGTQWLWKLPDGPGLTVHGQRVGGVRESDDDAPEDAQPDLCEQVSIFDEDTEDTPEGAQNSQDERLREKPRSDPKTPNHDGVSAYDATEDAHPSPDGARSPEGAHLLNKERVSIFDDPRYAETVALGEELA
jgi:putative DNA primase/helicase